MATTDNVVDFHQDSTRALLRKVLDAYDKGLIQSVVLVAQGIVADEDGTERKVLMPLVSEETTLAQACIAGQVVQMYTQSAISGTILHGEHREV